MPDGWRSRERYGEALARLDRDLSKRGAELDQILGRTDAEARMLQLHKKAGRFAFQAEIRGRCLSLSGCP